MSGIVGFTNGHLSPDASRPALRRMQEMLTHNEHSAQGELFCDERLCATIVQSNDVQKRTQPHVESGVHVWLDGEFYNREELARRAGVPHANGAAPVSDAALLLECYRAQTDLAFLVKIDGIYSAVIYDEGRRRLYLLTDRYGLRHLYLNVRGGTLAWASEVKAMLALPGFTPEIDEAAVADFFGTGCLPGDSTWFEGVELLAAANVLEWDLEDGSARRRRYWSAGEIKPLAGKTDATELAEELGRLFKAGVEKRCRAGERVGLTLSGGLDSRAILAAMPYGESELHAVTFGKSACEDIRVAAAAAKKKGATHHTIELSASSWLLPRVGGVWRTDGQLDLLHMHVVSIIPEACALFRIGLDGCGANGIIGDSWIANGQSGPAEYIDSRTRRFLILGPRLVRDWIEERFPFFDNDFIELALAAPCELKKANALYRMMLLKTFPSFFESIPWQRTGSPIRWPQPGEERGKYFANLKDSLLEKLNWYGLYRAPSRGYADYADWIRQEPARDFFQQILRSSSAIYPAYVPRERVERDLAKHLGGGNRPESLTRALTFEIWLQQVFNDKYRPAPQGLSSVAATVG